TPYGAMPEVVRREGPRSFDNFMGVTLGGSTHPSTVIAAEMAEEFSGKDRVSVVGRRTGVDMLHAAFVNTVASCADVFDDTHLATVTLPPGPAAAALLALAEGRKLRGEAFLGALIRGIGATCRLGMALITPQAKGNVG